MYLPADPGVDVVLLLEKLDGDGEGGAAAPRAKGCRERVRHVRNEPVNASQCKQQNDERG